MQNAEVELAAVQGARLQASSAPRIATQGALFSHPLGDFSHTIMGSTSLRRVDAFARADTPPTGSTSSRRVNAFGRADIPPTGSASLRRVDALARADTSPTGSLMKGSFAPPDAGSHLGRSVHFGQRDWNTEARSMAPRGALPPGYQAFNSYGGAPIAPQTILGREMYGGYGGAPLAPQAYWGPQASFVQPSLDPAVPSMLTALLSAHQANVTRCLSTR
jgi:hypothetical protein